MIKFEAPEHKTLELTYQIKRLSQHAGVDLTALRITEKTCSAPRWLDNILPADKVCVIQSEAPQQVDLEWILLCELVNPLKQSRRKVAVASHNGNTWAIRTAQVHLDNYFPSLLLFEGCIKSHIWLQLSYQDSLLSKIYYTTNANRLKGQREVIRLTPAKCHPFIQRSLIKTRDKWHNTGTCTVHVTQWRNVPLSHTVW